MIKGILYLAILTTAVVFSLIGFSVYHNYTTSTIEPDTQIVITPIPAQFDQETIEKLKSKQNIQADLSQKRPTTVVAPEQTTTSVTATASGNSPAPAPAIEVNL